MANINLLPWREEQRQERQRHFLSVLGLVALLAIAVGWSVHLLYVSKISNQKERNQYLQTEIRKLESKIKEIDTLEKERLELVERMNIIQDLQKSRPQIVHVFDEIVSTIPEGVNLEAIERKENNLILNGVAESSPRISNFMRNISVSKWLKLGPLEAISGNNESGASRKRFRLKTNISSPSSSEEEKQP